MGAKVVGVSKDSVKSHKKFAEKYDLNFPLLADSDGELCRAFGTLNMLGIVKRSTFIIENREIIKAFNQVKVSGHVEEVIEFLKQL